MTFSIRIGGKESVIQLEKQGPECRFRLGAAAERYAEVEEPEPDVYSVLMDGRSYEARVESGTNGTVVVSIEGHRFEIDVQDPRRYQRRDGRRGAEGVQKIVAPMPGKVVRVLVKAGETVEAGQGLLVMEAMKMQNEMRAPKAGRVLSVPAREGATVAAGAVLATIE